MDEPAVMPAASGVGERKQITAVFLDVVGFSDMASTADAEDLQLWLEDFYAQCNEAMTLHDGEVTEYLGDGVVALFGLKRADELTAAKAVTAALGAIERITKGADRDIALRIGIATGEAAVRAANASDNLPRATGMVTTLAQRVQQMAEPGTVMMSESTYQLLRDIVAVEAFPGQMLKGFADPQTLYRPLPAQPPEDPIDELPFVGRAVEKARILASTDPCLLIGPAGIGKTALARNLAQVDDKVTRLAADGVNTRASYQPFMQWVMQQTGSTLPDFADLQKRFAGLPDQAIQALALVLGLPEGQRLLAEVSNVALKALIEDSLWRAIQDVQPEGMLIIEDLHWLDNASFGVLVHILQSDSAARYRVVMTSREDTKIGKYLGRMPITMVPLDPLDDAEASLMLEALSETESDDRAALIEKAAGVPLFLAQLSKLTADQTKPDATLPGTLMDLLADQIDATGESKPVLQCAAVIGPAFDVEMLGAIAGDHAPLEPHLEKARARGVVQKTGPQSWRFAHALLHQAAYQGMLRRTRIDFHSSVAAHLQDNHADAVRRNPTLLTDHLRQAQQHIPAIQNLLGVSQWALYQGAFDDAEAHLLVAITLCEEAPAELDVRALEIACHTALGSVRMQTLGFTAEPVRDAFAKVSDLAARQNTYSEANGPAFYGTFTHAIVSGDKSGADEFSMRLREAAEVVAEGDQTHAVRLASLNVDVALHFYSGSFEQQFAEFAKLRDVYDIAKHGAMIATYGADTFAAAQMFETAGRAISGDTHQVAGLIAETDAHQDLLNIPVMQPWAQIWGAVPLYYAGETQTAVARVLAGLETAASQAAAFWQVTGGSWLNVMDPSQSDTPEGLAGFAQIIQTNEMIGANVGLPYFRSHYAVALAKHGQDDAAYQASLQASRENEASGLLCWYPEVLRLHAQICRGVGRIKDSERYLEEAVEVATRQNARLWLLRAQLDQVAAGTVDPSALQGTCDSFHASANPPELAQARALLAA